MKRRRMESPRTLFLFGLVCLCAMAETTALARAESPHEPDTSQVPNSTNDSPSQKMNSLDPSDIVFNLYTPNNQDIPIRIFPANITAASTSTFCVGAPLKYVLHGFEGYAEEPWLPSVKDAYLLTGRYNVILVDWPGLCAKADISMVPNVYVVAKYGAVIVGGLVATGVVNITNVHLIGHGIGAHAASLTANLVTASGAGTVARITGLDPTRTVFEKFGDDYRLDPSDAPMVDVIHTDGGSTGFLGSRGTVDFYPNGGKTQPGCSVHGCCHYRATELFMESIINRKAFKACKCSSYEDYKKKKCRCSDSTNMGEHASCSASGSYFLQTNKRFPYDKASKYV